MDSNSQSANNTSDALTLPRWMLGSREDFDPAGREIVGYFDEFRDPLFRYLLVILRNAAEAEDAVQEAFLRLYQELRAQRRIDHVKSWLFRTGHNLAIDRHRTREGRCEDSLERAAFEVADERYPTSEETVLLQERLVIMRKAVDRLSGQQRICLHLRTQGFRYREIADIMHVSESTVCENLRRGLTRLMKDLHAE
jgi:RNA polymerase sigma-70 factor, ECF subfamily